MLAVGYENNDRYHGSIQRRVLLLSREVNVKLNKNMCYFS